MRMGRVSRLGIGDGDGDAVDLHAVVGGDEDEAPPVDDPGLHHIAVLRRHGDLHLRGGDLEFAGLDDVPGVQGGVLAVLPAAGLLEGLRLFLRQQGNLSQGIMPDILAFYESEEGQREFEEWKKKQNGKTKQRDGENS